MIRKTSRLNCRIPRHLFASHWIRIAAIVIYLVLQSTPTLVNGWPGYSVIAPKIVLQRIRSKRCCLENWVFFICYFSKMKRISTKTIMQWCFSCRNKSVCQKLASSCKKWNSAQTAIVIYIHVHACPFLREIIQFFFMLLAIIFLLSFVFSWFFRYF